LTDNPTLNGEGEEKIFPKKLKQKLDNPLSLVKMRSIMETDLKILADT